MPHQAADDEGLPLYDEWCRIVHGMASVDPEYISNGDGSLLLSQRAEYSLATYGTMELVCVGIRCQDYGTTMGRSGALVGCLISRDSTLAGCSSVT